MWVGVFFYNIHSVVISQEINFIAHNLFNECIGVGVNAKIKYNSFLSKIQEALNLHEFESPVPDVSIVPS